MSDVEFREAGNPCDGFNIAIRQAVPAVNMKSERMAQFDAVRKFLQRLGTGLVIFGVGVIAGPEFECVEPQVC